MSPFATRARQHIVPTTPIHEAGAIWLARLEIAGLDDDDEDENNIYLDDEEQARREDQRHHSRQTIESYHTAFTLFARWVERSGRTTVGQLALDDLVSYTRTLRRRDYDLSNRATQERKTGTQPPQRLSPRTVRAYTRPLLGFFALLESFQAIRFSTEAVRAELVRVLPRIPDAFAPTPPDLRRVVTFYDRPHSEHDDRTERLHLIRLRNAALLHMLFSTGARISEVLGLNVGNVYRNGRIQSRVTVYGKGRREETIFVRNHAERAIHRYLSHRGHPPAANPLFESFDRRNAGMRLSRFSAWRIVRQAAETVAVQIELEGKHEEAELLRTASPHTFRHFVGYYLLNEGADLAEVSQILRHRNVEVTRNFYARYKDVQLQEVHDQYSPDPEVS